MGLLIRLAESGYVPDPLLRAGIRRLLRQRLREGAGDRRLAAGDARIAIATATDRANEQHYELPPAFFELMLGPRLKYSCCRWDDHDRSLDRAEDAMLALSCERAAIADGMRVLDLGSGWGSLGLWIAERYPACRVTTVSNSASQQRFIGGRAAAAGLTNVETIRGDVNAFEPSGRYDRVVSVEMFEHVRDHATLLRRIARWLTPDGALFVHLFCHRTLCYPYEIEGDGDWMARHFFTGGMMPSLDMLDRLDDVMQVARRWEIDGTQYERTLLAWLARLDSQRERALEILAAHYGSDDAHRWFVRWRIFLLACAELFGFRDGREWLVAHYRMQPVAAR